MSRSLHPRACAFASLAILTLVLVSCSSKAPESKSEATTQAAPNAAVGDRPDFQNLTLRDFEMAHGDAVFHEGKWEAVRDSGDASGPTAEILDDELRGDLDGDGQDEFIAMLSASGGGSGSYTYVVPFGKRNGAWTQLAPPVDLGDRIEIEMARIEPGRLVYDIVQQGPDDPMCCPTEYATLMYTLSNGRLVAQPPQVHGKYGVTAVLTGTWVLDQFDDTEPVPAGVQISMTYADGVMKGNAGCNDYKLTCEDGDELASLRMGRAATTRKACDEPLASRETRYLECLAGANQLHLGGPGRVLIGYKVGDRTGVLGFTRTSD